MNIEKITYCTKEDLFLDLTLGMNALNDFALNRNFIKIRVMDPDPLNFIYRRFFEDVYLHRSSENISKHIKERTYDIMISVGEAVNIIKELVPPVFKHRVHEIYATTESLVETLEYYLTDIDTGTLDMQINIFKKCIGWKPFETVSTYDKSRMDTVRSKTIEPGESGGSIDLYAVRGDFKDVFEGNSDADIEMQCVFAFDYKRYLYELIDILDQNNSIKICNVFTPDGAKYTCVEFYIEHYDYTDNPKLHDMIHDSYTKILGKDVVGD